MSDSTVRACVCILLFIVTLTLMNRPQQVYYGSGQEVEEVKPTELCTLRICEFTVDYYDTYGTYRLYIVLDATKDKPHDAYLESIWDRNKLRVHSY